MTDQGKPRNTESETSAIDEVPKLRARVAHLEQENRRLRERCEEAELQIVQLERGVKSVENTLSFRLGNALIQSTKSVSGLKALPQVIGELRQDARQRRGGDNARDLLSSTLRASAAIAQRGVKAKKGKKARG
jgi:predicted RNase H-like nuclease (RuvC/YqgF family)